MKQNVEYQSGNVLSYAEYGNPDGFPIFIQHGMVASITDYHLFDSLIDLGARLICVARPGYGESSPYRMKNMAEYGDIVAALVEKLAIPQFDVLGMSSGAPYSYALGYKLAQKVRNIFIFSGTPALYDPGVVALWPFEIKPEATLGELEKVAREVFFANLSKEDLLRDDIIDSMQHDCFGVAQDLKLRCNDWGFTLAEVPGKAYMQHCKDDNNVPFSTAEITAGLLPNCQLNVVEKGGHFSPKALNDFIRNLMAKHY